MWELPGALLSLEAWQPRAFIITASSSKRRGRKTRAQARTLLRVAEAAAELQSHQSRPMGGQRNGGWRQRSWNRWNGESWKQGDKDSWKQGEENKGSWKGGNKQGYGKEEAKKDKQRIAELEAHLAAASTAASSASNATLVLPEDVPMYDLDEGSFPFDILERAWRRQIVKVGVAPDWCAVRGPAAATILSLRRAGWSWPSFRWLGTREGLQIDLLQVCPCDVREMLRRATELMMLENWTPRLAIETGNWSLLPRPFVEPVVRLMRRRVGGKWTPRHANAAQHAVVTVAWTQADWYTAGKADSLLCQRCGVQVGTAYLRHFCCEARGLKR